MAQRGFEVRPAALQAGAKQVHGDSEDLDSARSTTAAAAGAAAGASGGNPLAAALGRLQGQLDIRGQELRTTLDETASALDASAATYLEDDAFAAAELGGVLLPGGGAG